MGQNRNAYRRRKALVTTRRGRTHHGRWSASEPALILRDDAGGVAPA